MTKKVRHVLGISGGKDSAALAIYMKDNYPELDIEYYCCDTGKELEATYKLIDNLEHYLDKPIIRLNGATQSSQDPFDHFYHLFGDYLPSSTSRWCTKYLKLIPFENFVGDDQVISYVGIRGDEDRDGYISKKSNIQSIFPFRRNIWSEDVVSRVLKNDSIAALKEIYIFKYENSFDERFLELLSQPVSVRFSTSQKANVLIGRATKEFNNIVSTFLKFTNYPIGKLDNFPVLDNEENLVRDDIFKILRTSGVGIPDYYEKKTFNLNEQLGEYARSRSGCYFCFFQQKIEWIWLYEQHPEWFTKAMAYEDEKAGFTWNQNESLRQLTEPERLSQIKADYLKKKKKDTSSQYLLDILDEAESEGCAACFI